MTTGTTRTEATAIRAVKGTVDEQFNAMKAIDANIEKSIEELRHNFQASSSTIFQQKIADWQAKYNELAGKYNTFHGQLEQGERSINSGQEHSNTIATGIGNGAGSYVEDVLGGKK
ncbi:hypothetical protein ACFVFS_35350 [Kitasatospora sp. NPDC057692]|uniref:hypothetical protein n=1 Tax=Kitasatospora sp. NPDC057692 TaxID=3346215 RepID=UPI0036C3CD41